MPHTSEVLADLVSRLRRAPPPRPSGPATFTSDRVVVLERAELEAAWRGGILELDRSATFEINRSAVLPAANPTGEIF